MVSLFWYLKLNPHTLKGSPIDPLKEPLYISLLWHLKSHPSHRLRLGSPELQQLLEAQSFEILKAPFPFAPEGPGPFWALLLGACKEGVVELGKEG